MWHPGLKLESVEREAILHALAFYQGKREETAYSLGISAKTLAAKLEGYRKMGIAVLDPPSRKNHSKKADAVEVAPEAKK